MSEKNCRMHRRRVSLNFGTGLESDVAGEERRYALVTGASQGLGRCYALELARCGIDTVLVSLPDSGLNAGGYRVAAFGGAMYSFRD